MRRIILLAVSVLVILALPLLVFCIRSPVLIVTDAPFTALYGAERMKREGYTASLALFRRVKPVPIADSAGSDLVVVAVSQAAPRPYCVLFSRRHSEAAERYHEEYPEIPCVLLTGLANRSMLPSADGIFCVYGTDRETDLYRAGLFAGILADLKRSAAKQAGDTAAPQTAGRTFVLWQDRSANPAHRELFSAAAKERYPDAEVAFINNLGALPGAEKLSCVVVTENGSEYMANPPKVPVILFGWLDPAITSREVVVLFDDSPWGIAVPAVRMAVKNEADGAIPSKPLIVSKKINDRSITRMLAQSAQKTPQKNHSETLTKN